MGIKEKQMTDENRKAAYASLKYISERFEGHNLDKMKGHFDAIEAALQQQDKTLEVLKGVRDALELSITRCQNFLDTFGDFGASETQADINDWHEQLSALNSLIGEG